MTTFILASYDPKESAVQRTRKKTLVRAHAARAAHAARRENQPSRSLRGVPCSRGNSNKLGFDSQEPGHAVQNATPPGGLSIAAAFSVSIDRIPAHLGKIYFAGKIILLTRPEETLERIHSNAFLSYYKITSMYLLITL